MALQNLANDKSFIRHSSAIHNGMVYCSPLAMMPMGKYAQTQLPAEILDSRRIDAQ